jgi:hypothetical protein
MRSLRLMKKPLLLLSTLPFFFMSLKAPYASAALSMEQQLLGEDSEASNGISYLSKLWPPSTLSVERSLKKKKDQLAPSEAPSDAPSETPLAIPSAILSYTPTDTPSSTPTHNITTTYVPGHLTVEENGLLLSEGLTTRLIATTHLLVKYDIGGNMSTDTFPTDLMLEQHLWICVQEMKVGGSIRSTPGLDHQAMTQINTKGALELGALIDFQMVLENTRANCGGGTTPWGA